MNSEKRLILESSIERLSLRLKTVNEDIEDSTLERDLIVRRMSELKAELEEIEIRGI